MPSLLRFQESIKKGKEKMIKNVLEKLPSSLSYPTHSPNYYVLLCKVEMISTSIFTDSFLTILTFLLFYGISGNQLLSQL